MARKKSGGERIEPSFDGRHDDAAPRVEAEMARAVAVKSPTARKRRKGSLLGLFGFIPAQTPLSAKVFSQLKKINTLAKSIPEEILSWCEGAFTSTGDIKKCNELEKALQNAAPGDIEKIALRKDPVQGRLLDKELLTVLKRLIHKAIIDSGGRLEIQELRQRTPELDTLIKKIAATKTMSEKTIETVLTPPFEHLSPKLPESNFDDLLQLSKLKRGQKVSFDEDGRIQPEKAGFISRVGNAFKKADAGDPEMADKIRARFWESALSCSQEDLPRLKTAFLEFAETDWAKDACAKDKGTAARYAVMKEPATWVMFGKKVEESVLGTLAFLMPSKAFSDADRTIKPNGMNNNLTNHLSLATAASIIADKLDAYQSDLVLDTSGPGPSEATAPTRLDDAWRVYHEGSHPATTHHDLNAGVDIAEDVSYPATVDKKGREGDPAADDALYALVPMGKTTVVVYGGADGCGRSASSQKAAVAVNDAFVTYCQEHIRKSSSSPQTMTRIALDGLVEADKKVKEKEIQGNTTFCGIIRVQNPNEPPYAVAALVGDMKVFIRSEHGTVRELTEGNRGTDPRDPGGMLGMDTDIRNLSAYIVPLQPGDQLLPMSDGVHDNLDPCELGLLPEQAFDEIMASKTSEQKKALKGIDRTDLLEATKKWKEARAGIKDGELVQTKKGSPPPVENPWPDAPPFEKLRAAYMRYKIEQIGAENPTLPLSQALVSYAMKTTSGIRHSMETGARQPAMWSFLEDAKRREYAGKTDHVSCGLLTEPRTVS